MFEKRKIDLLTNKYYLLGEEQLKLLKEGKYDKAEKVNKEMDEIAKKIQELTGKKLDKTAKKSSKLTAKIDKKIEKSGLYPSVSDEDAERALEEIMKSR